ncbi:flagellar export chaperone FliS [Croceicoccus gelatinilyticus]|uniref:flagellar export chaperone FliS n=1 Tax=Croceicoccus gelatinilyticus TaxID=2835536 RepID=UPI001BCDB925|nr:flagellar protein FliS [Croceicoccus gelatinilyticus]MBS7671345.1 flagellar protein FliS [Croceicoccus gelatinilyticus]
MLSRRLHPAEAYRQVEFDARVNGASPHELTAICFEQLIASIGTAIYAHEAENPELRSRSISRAVSSVIALEMGISGNDVVANAMRDLYGRARQSLLASAIRFNPDALAMIRTDFSEIAEALGLISKSA